MSDSPTLPHAYYPEGWDRERLLNSAATGEIATLSEEQRVRFREGLKADLGPQGFNEFFDEMFKREIDSKGNSAAAPVAEPPFMEVMRLHDERRGSAHPWAQWGFVVFTSPEVRDAALWKACHQRFEAMLHDQINSYHGYEGLKDCIARMRFEWIEGGYEADSSIAAVSEAYAEMDLPPGLNHSMCLYITPASLHSIIDSPPPSAANRRYRKDIPFVVAVSKRVPAETEQQPPTSSGGGEGDEEHAGANWRGYFNVAVESLLDSFFPAVASDSRTPFEIGGNITGEDIYCDHTRWGIHKAGVGYWDKRAEPVSTEILVDESTPSIYEEGRGSDAE
ncbi:hypothetical protein F4809DRAFT_644547 [Biscogniauxia mediterranea]|nr:hypothetical protein F4809DRAFT_644547 [Biscogniauxia mediterranea]